MKERAIYSQPISEGGQNWTSKPNQTQSRAVEGGWKINGFKKFASLAGYCDYYTIVCTEVFEGSSRGTRTRCCSSSTRMLPA
jgi:alkylation response protein AidB-like acyl-CoA dehydrogenase